MAKGDDAPRKSPARRRAPKKAADPTGDAAALKRALREALEQQAATAEILRAISAAEGDLTAVFTAILENAIRLCDVEMGHIYRVDGDFLHPIAACGVSREREAMLKERGTWQPDPRSGVPETIRLKKPMVIEDLSKHILYAERTPSVVAMVEQFGLRTLLHVPLMKDDEAVGVIVLYRRVVRPFTKQQIELVSGFADQAVIAIENARLLSELRESLETQTASAEIMRAIASTPEGSSEIFETIVTSAQKLLQSDGASIMRIDGDVPRRVAVSGLAAQASGLLGVTIDRRTPGGRAIVDKGVVHVEDILRDAEEFPAAPAVLGKTPTRTVLAAPLIRDSEPIGSIALQRADVRPFVPKEIELLKSFADQAVIAIENARLLSELRESLDRQTATSEVLGAISSSLGELEPVFDAILRNGLQLCDASMGHVYRLEDGAQHLAAIRGASPEYEAFVRDRGAHELGEDMPHARAIREKAPLHVPDVRELPIYTSGHPGAVAAVELAGQRTALYVPLLRGENPLGVIIMYRRDVRPFNEKQIALVEDFADQAVIAIENARLLEELNTRNSDLAESLEQQTATSEILRTIASSPAEAERALDKIAGVAARMFDAPGVNIRRVDGDRLRVIGSAGAVTKEVSAELPDIPLDGSSIIGAAVQERRLIHLKDPSQPNAADGFIPQPGSPLDQLFTRAGRRSAAAVPLMRESEAIGGMVVIRTEVRPFTASELALLESFADQAVIAIENARLLEELNTRNRDLAESLEQQTATSEILRVISSSAADTQPVFDAIVAAGLRLFPGETVSIALPDGDQVRVVAIADSDADRAARWRSRFPFPLTRDYMHSACILDRRIIDIPDVADGPEEFMPGRKNFLASGYRGVTMMPMIRGEEAIGAVSVVRIAPGPLTDKQRELLKTFADQAVIAIENARLLGELRDSLERRTAIAEVLHVISSSPGEVEPVFTTMLEKAVRLCDATEGSVFSASGNTLRRIAGQGVSADLRGIEEFVAAPGSPPGRMLSTRKSVHIPDLVEMLAQIPELRDTPTLAGARAVVERGARTALWVPMIRDGSVIGAFVLHRREPRPFSAAQIGLVETFASQAIIAIENARLLSELRTARDEAEEALGDLRAAQASLIQAEKMASLGQLTAGIAHEIKNPLNFVNNFATLSVELLDELKAELGDDRRAEVEELIGMLTGNLEKVAEHGRRADGIVKSMLAHSRGSSGERQGIDLNALVEESLNLAYHGARAQDQTFNVTMESELDPSLGPIEVVPQDLTRVFLNLFGNGFYAANKRRRETGNDTFRPVVKVTTQDLGTNVVIRIRDNGTGIPPELRPKLFEPFFTTKPTGEGTGLGLSISYEIVTKEHGGSIDVDSVPGEFTEFRITLPRRAGSGTGGQS